MTAFAILAMFKGGGGVKSSLFKTILKSRTLPLQAELPKSGENLVKETFECGRRLAKNKVKTKTKF